MPNMRVAGVLALACLMAAALPSTAEEAPEAAGEITSEVDFEVRIPPEVFSDRLERINTGGLVVQPGVRATVGSDVEAIRGRLLFVESGQVELTPMVDSPVWQDGVTNGDATGSVQGGETVLLEQGELIFLPVIAPADVTASATIGIANPGTSPAVLRGFHGHSGGGNDTWPDGVSVNEGFVEARDQDHMSTLMSAGAAFRQTRLTAPAGASLVFDDTALFAMLDVYDGKVKRSATGPEGVMAPFWNPIKGGYLPVDPDWAFDVVVDGDEPATLYVLEVVPAE